MTDPFPTVGGVMSVIFSSMVDDALRGVRASYSDVVTLLDRAAALRSAPALLVNDGADVGWIAETAETGDLRVHTVVGERTTMLRGLRVQRGFGLTGKVGMASAPDWVDDYFGSARITHTFDQHIAAEDIHRLLGVPVIWKGQLIAVLAAGVRATGSFGDRAVHHAEAIAEQVALAVAVADRARLAREVAVHQERSRLAAELHDSVGALLFAIGSRAAGLADTVADPAVAAALSRLQSEATDASGALRDSLRMLRASPSALALSIELSRDCREFSDRTGVPAQLVMLDDEAPTLPPSRSRVLISAVREALLNVEKHADASAVAVVVSQRVRRGHQVLSVEVTDDGVGLRDESTWGLGLTSTQEAVARLGGALHVGSDPDGGTVWRMEMPC